MQGKTASSMVFRVCGILLACATSPGARADLLVSSNDGHTVMDEQKNLVAPGTVAPDTVTLIDVGHYPPTIRATIEAPGSVVGPPGAVWISPDESWGIVTSATKADPGGKFGISPDNRVSVLEGVMYFPCGLIHTGGHDSCPQILSF